MSRSSTPRSLCRSVRSTARRELAADGPGPRRLGDIGRAHRGLPAGQCHRPMRQGETTAFATASAGSVARSARFMQTFQLSNSVELSEFTTGLSFTLSGVLIRNNDL